MEYSTIGLQQQVRKLALMIKASAALFIAFLPLKQLQP
jgi:hypothetical protein